MPTIDFPACHRKMLEEGWRYYIAYGGRAGLKSHSAAIALLTRGRAKKMRILCAREIQNSISDSVHHLLRSMIERYWDDGFWKITETEIVGQNGTQFLFMGLRTNINKVKSYEDLDICWVEEAANVSKNSWDVLIPTIRKEGSQILITFNPELDTDETWERFVAHPPSNSIVVKTTYKDNKWMSATLVQEMEDCKKKDPATYDNVWLGNCRSSVEGAIFADQIRRAEEEGRINDDVEYNRMVDVCTYWDLGKANKTAIWFAQYVGDQWRMLRCITGFGGELEGYLDEITKLPYSYHTHYLPHDARHDRLGMQRSIEEQVRARLGNVEIVERVQHKINAIEAAKTIFPLCWFHKTDCGDGLQDMRRYAYKVSDDGKVSREPDHRFSDVPDAYMTFAMAAQPYVPKEYERPFYVQKNPRLG